MTRHDKRMTPAEVRVRLELWPADGLRDILNGLAVAVRNKRKATGQSVRAVGAELGIPWNCVSRTERRIGEPSVATFVALVRWLDVPGWGECEFSLRTAHQGCPCGCPVVEDMCCCTEPCPCSPCGYCDAPAGGPA